MKIFSKLPRKIFRQVIVTVSQCNAGQGEGLVQLGLRDSPAALRLREREEIIVLKASYLGEKLLRDLSVVLGLASLVLPLISKGAVK